MSAEKKMGIVNAFKRLPQTILWKWESDSFTEDAKNIHIKRWLPQIDVLCKTKMRFEPPIVKN
jgi:glucuronosyltransferase